MAWHSICEMGFYRVYSPSLAPLEEVLEEWILLVTKESTFQETLSTNWKKIWFIHQSNQSVQFIHNNFKSTRLLCTSLIRTPETNVFPSFSLKDSNRDNRRLHFYFVECSCSTSLIYYLHIDNVLVFLFIKTVERGNFELWEVFWEVNRNAKQRVFCLLFRSVAPSLYLLWLLAVNIVVLGKIIYSMLYTSLDVFLVGR